MLTAATTGFATAFSLILAIGAQNAFVLRQGLLKQHLLPVCLFCAVSDAVLITAGVLGFGAVVERFPALPTAMGLGGAAFLIVYGTLRFQAAWRGDYHMVLAGVSAPMLQTIAVAAAITWLNPHVYLDTLGLIGAVSTQFRNAGQPTAFTAGAIVSSFVFFFSLGYGARFLAPVMQSAAAWRKLDILIGCVMWLIAAGLIHSSI